MQAKITPIRGCLRFIVAVLVSCTAPQPAPFAPGHRPGDILQAAPLTGAPAGATATRILYASTAPDGTPIAVSGLVIVPPVPAPPGGRPVLAWLHATTGVDRACAPSTGPAPFAQIQGLPAFLAAGYAVVATDYAGLGGPGTHPYLVGASEARAALDSVRAAGRLPGVQAGQRFAVWGHSQGGHAALFTAELARAYAPELRLVGVAAAAPVTDVAALVEQPGQDPLWGALLSYTVWSWSRVFGAAADTIVPATARPTIERTAKDCLESADELNRLLNDAAPLQGEPVTPDAHWRTLLAENAPAPQPGGPPVFLAQGDADPIISPPLTRDFARRLCREDTPVRYLAMPGVDHYTAAARSAAAAADWIAARFAGASPPDDCAALQ
jgi:pimeloyl-ACP methyl ester carboxylesterase